MKEVILLLLKDVGAWGALGIGLAVAFFCYQPELVLNKVSEILSTLVNLFKIGG